jgi:uncharacterized membrane protein
MQFRTEFNNNSSNPFSSIFSIIMIILVMLGLFYLARFIFTILYYLSPIMLIAALVIDHKVVTGYAQWIVGLFKKNPIMGIGSVLLTAIGFPVVTTFLLGKALFKKRVKAAKEEAEKARKGEFIEFEELDTKPLELPELETRKAKKKDAPDSSEYDKLFD